jgi:subtilisin family serine protease
MRALGTLLTAAAIAAAGTAVPAQAAVGKIVGAGLPGAIPGRYIVTMKASRAGMSAQAVGSSSSYTATMTAAQARHLAADPDVQFVEQDRMLHIEATQKNPDWGLDRIDQRTAKPSKTYTPMDDGSSVTAYIIDTGIRITHSEFRGRATYGYDFVDNDTVAADCNGHGTHVAGTIGGTHYGVAKKVRMVAVRVLDCQGEGSLSDVIEGINWVTAHAVKPAVANMSLGGSYSASLEAAVQKSINSGVTYVVAAGNENSNASTESPAGLPAAITVGATDNKDRRASFSNYGSVLDIFAPGVDIRSSVASSDTATASYSGTSMAAPHVAGVAALVLDAAPGYSPQQVRDYLVAKATTGTVTDLKGSPNRLLFVPAPLKAPVIKTSGISVTAGQAFTGTLALTASRRGTWSLVAGSLPRGLKLASNGVISGTPTGPGTAAVKVRFIDYVPNTVVKALTVTVRKTTPVITSGTLPAATTGAGYTAQLTANHTGTWALTSGALPAGLTLAANGVLSGVPTTAGTSAFTVTLTDGFGSKATKLLTLDVS